MELPSGTNDAKILSHAPFPHRIIDRRGPSVRLTLPLADVLALFALKKSHTDCPNSNVFDTGSSLMSLNGLAVKARPTRRSPTGKTTRIRLV